MLIYSKYIPAKSHPDPIWNDGALAQQQEEQDLQIKTSKTWPWLDGVEFSAPPDTV